MNVYEMVVVIVALSLAAGVLNNYIRSRAKQAKTQNPSVHADELEQLRERVAVLEKIITDDRYHLQRELNALEEQA